MTQCRNLIPQCPGASDCDDGVVHIMTTIMPAISPDAQSFCASCISVFCRGLLPPGSALVRPAAPSTSLADSAPHRHAQLFDAVWSSVIEGLGRNGQPERANKMFEEMMEQLSADTAVAATASGKKTGWRGSRVHQAPRRDARLFDAYLRAGLLQYVTSYFISNRCHSAASAQFLFPRALEIFDIMSSHRCSPSTHTYRPASSPPHLPLQFRLRFDV